MPMPVSRTTIVQCRVSALALACTSSVTWPRSVNLMALCSRLNRIWRTRVASASTQAGRGSSPLRCSCRPFCVALACIRAHTSCSRRAMSVGSGVMPILPASSADMSRISLSRRSRCCAELRAVCTQSRWCALSGPSSSSRSSMPSMPLKGVRSSWLMLARNWLFSRLAVSARALAQRSSALSCSSATCSRCWWRWRAHSAPAAPSSPITCASSSALMTWFCSCSVSSCSSIRCATWRLATNDSPCTSGPSPYSASSTACSGWVCCQGCAISGSIGPSSACRRCARPWYSGLARSGAMLGVRSSRSKRLSKIS